MTKEAMRFLSQSDPRMAWLIKQVGPIDLKANSKQSPYEALVESVVYQQLTGKAAATILGRVIGLFPKSRFPKPEQIVKCHTNKLRSAGLSRSKVKAIKDVARQAIDGVVPSSRLINQLSDEEIIDRLTGIFGIGKWSVEMLLIFKLGREDVWPITDYGIRKGFALTYKLKELPPPKYLQKFGEKWSPHRTTAAWYLWRANDL